MKRLLDVEISRFSRYGARSCSRRPRVCGCGDCKTRLLTRHSTRDPTIWRTANGDGKIDAGGWRMPTCQQLTTNHRRSPPCPISTAMPSDPDVDVAATASSSAAPSRASSKASSLGGTSSSAGPIPIELSHHESLEWGRSSVADASTDMTKSATFIVLALF